MKIVIDVPDEDYKDIVDGYVCAELADELLDLVKNGIPVPTDKNDRGICFNCEYKTDACQEGLHCIRDGE